MTGSRKKVWSALILIVVLLAALALIFAAPSLALARAGGGDHYGGGGDGGGGGGGGGGDDGLFYLIWIIFRLVPFPFNVILIAVVLAAFYLAKRKRAGRTGTVMNTILSAPQTPAFVPPPAPLAAAPVSPQMTAASLSDLKSRDPNFSEQQFEDLASTAFFKIQEAWATKDMAVARAFASPALFQRFETQLGQLRQKGWTNKIENLVIGSIDVAEAVHDGGFDYVTARINAAAADYTVDDKTGAIVGGTRNQRQFSEYWTFLRSDQVKTVAGKTELTTQKCPNCGAPIAMNALGKCDYCASDIVSGKFSWVLSEVVQASVWRPRAQSVRPDQVSPLAAGRYVLGLVQCPHCGANVQDLAGITDERCWRCGGVVATQK